MKSSGQVNAAMRQVILDRYDIIGTPPEQNYDDIVKLAAAMCEMPVAVISFIDHDRVWFKARLGTPDPEMPAAVAPCAIAVTTPGEVLVITDTATDTRVTARREQLAAAGIRFYAGAPLITPEGYAVGTVCVTDCVPRVFSAEKASTLAALARQVMAMLELRRHTALLRDAQEKLAEHDMTDLLTSLPSRPAFEQKILSEGARAQRSKQDLSLLLVEVADLPDYRQTQGHEAADFALQEIAKILKANARPYDYAARFDAQKFALILPGTPAQGANMVAARLQLATTNTKWPFAAVKINVGISHLTAQSDYSSLLLAADTALQQSRHPTPPLAA